MWKLKYGFSVKLHYNRIENLLKFENTDSKQALINREIAGTMDPPIRNMCAYCVREKHLAETLLGHLTSYLTLSKKNVHRKNSKISKLF